MTAPCCHPQSQSKWYLNKTFLLIFILALVVFLSYISPFLIPLRQALFMYFKTIWWAVALGLTISGVMDYYVPRKLISHVLAKPKKRTILYAVGLGFFASVCSHGILAISIELHKKGASTPAVIAFLLASPWANLPLTLILIGFFGIAKSFYIIFSAIVVAIITGLIYQILETKGWIEKNTNSSVLEAGYSAWDDVRERFRGYRFSVEQFKADIKGIFTGIVGISDMVLWWILIGVGLASLSAAYIPPHLFHDYMGPTFSGLLVTLLLATVLEVCSEGMSPLAFEIYKQTGALGNSFVFLMAGVVTDYTEIGLLWQNVGRRAAIFMPIIAVPQVLILGMWANVLFR